ncbi:unnamed protein product [Clavelina lepadiformis]|uniref:Uncharacterized protein n=1 Tax=Clavelina lepadiformis TaxID=159417 RepID=A0ABP0GS66_CLALP
MDRLNTGETTSSKKLRLGLRITLFVIGTFTILLGGACIFLGIVLVDTHLANNGSFYSTTLGEGIWCGVWIVAAGVVSIVLSICAPKFCLVCTHLVFHACGILFAIALITISSIHALSLTTTNQFLELTMIMVYFAIAALVLLILCVLLYLCDIASSSYRKYKAQKSCPHGSYQSFEGDIEVPSFVETEDKEDNDSPQTEVETKQHTTKVEIHAPAGYSITEEDDEIKKDIDAGSDDSTSQIQADLVELKVDTTNVREASPGLSSSNSSTESDGTDNVSPNKSIEVYSGSSLSEVLPISEKTEQSPNGSSEEEIEHSVHESTVVLPEYKHKTSTSKAEKKKNQQTSSFSTWLSKFKKKRKKSNIDSNCSSKQNTQKEPSNFPTTECEGAVASFSGTHSNGKAEDKQTLYQSSSTSCSSSSSSDEDERLEIILPNQPLNNSLLQNMENAVLPEVPCKKNNNPPENDDKYSTPKKAEGQKRNPRWSALLEDTSSWAFTSVMVEGSEEKDKNYRSEASAPVHFPIVDISSYVEPSNFVVQKEHVSSASKDELLFVRQPTVEVPGMETYPRRSSFHLTFDHK